MYFVQPWRSHTDYLFYRLPYRVYCGIQINNESPVIRNYNHWTIEKTILHDKQEDTDFSWSFLITNPELTEKRHLVTLLQILKYIMQEWALWVLSSPITCDSDVNPILLKKLWTTPWTIHNLETFDPIPIESVITTKWLLIIRHNKDITSIDEIEKTTNTLPYQHCIIKNPRSQFIKNSSSTELESIQKTIKKIVRLREKMFSQRSQKNIDEIMQEIYYYRLLVVGIISKDNTFLMKLLWIEDALHKQFYTNSLILIPEKNIIHCINFWDTPINNDIWDHVHDWNTTISLLYNSLIDWGGEKWFCCEQWISKWIVHDYSPNIIMIKTFKSWTSVIEWAYDAEKEYAGIVLDGIRNKIIINWKTFNSKQLPSQKATIEILWTLIENYWETLKNFELPPSSYSKNKNTLVWKIIAPLSKALKKCDQEQLTFHIQWSLYNYTISLPKQHTSLLYIKKLY